MNRELVPKKALAQKYNFVVENINYFLLVYVENAKNIFYEKICILCKKKTFPISYCFSSNVFGNRANKHKDGKFIGQISVLPKLTNH